MAGKKQQAEVKQAQIRGWNLSDALILEIVEADVAPLFMLKMLQSWMSCATLEIALAAIWEEQRFKAALPPQWSEPAPEVVREWRRHGKKLRALQAGQWWPQPPLGHPGGVAA
ncbi:MAG: hypothetical protein ACHQIO_04275 [Nevskiales bacterium]